MDQHESRSMKRWQFCILIFELALFAVILVLPQVALPDFTFHEGTAPVAAHARICGQAPAAAITVAAADSVFRTDRPVGRRDSGCSGSARGPLPAFTAVRSDLLVLPVFPFTPVQVL